MLNNVVAKCALIPEQIKREIDLGFTKFEVQLLSDSDYKKLDVIKMFDNIDVVGVHTPLIDNKDVVLGELCADEKYSLFAHTCNLAQKLAELYGHKVYVILHNDLSRSQYELYKPLSADIMLRLSHLTTFVYPDVYVLIENVTPISNYTQLRNGLDIRDCVEVCKFFNEKYGARLLSCCFDTCHHMISKKLFEKIYKDSELAEQPDYIFPICDWQQIFEECSDYIKVMHLNNMTYDGETLKTHGTPFCECGEGSKLYKIMKAYVSNDCSAFITLEVREDDYLNPKNLLVTYDNLRKTMVQLHTELLSTY